MPTEISFYGFKKRDKMYQRYWVVNCILVYLSEPYLKHEIKLVGEAGLMNAGEESECWIMSTSDITAHYLLGQWPKNM